MPPKPYLDPLCRLQSPAPGHSNEESSSPSMVFRDRLQSVKPSGSQYLSPLEAEPEALSYNVIDLFRAGFMSDARPSPAEGQGHAAVGKAKPCDTLVGLSNAFAQAGSTIHVSAVEDLVKAHADVQKRIDYFVNRSSAILKTHDGLYSNAEWPLSQTRCSTDKHPCATVAEHLTRLEKGLKASKDMIMRLAQEWDQCLMVERRTWVQLDSQYYSQLDGSEQRDVSAIKERDLENEGRHIVELKCQLIDDIHQEFMEKIQVETQSMFRNVIF